MRIAVWHNLPSGGGKRALHDHLHGLKRLGHEIEVWSPSTADSGFLPLEAFATEHVRSLQWPPTPEARDFLRIRTSHQAQLAAMERHVSDCAKEINAGRFDVLFANSCAFFRTTGIGRFVKLPSILYLQEPFRWLYEAMPALVWAAPDASLSLNPASWRPAVFDMRQNWGRRVQVREEVRNARAFDRILVNSFFSRESVLRAYGLDAEVCYLGTDVKRFCDRGVAREFFVVGLGAFTPEKGVELAVRSIAELPPPRPPLVWIGNFADHVFLSSMSELANRLGVSLDVRVRVDDSQIVDLLNRAFAMIYTPRLEPFGLAPIEAAACGLPVVAVAEGGVRETVLNEVTGKVVAPNPAAIAAALVELASDPQAYAQLRLNARRNAVTNWSNDAAARRLETALHTLLDRRGLQV